MELKDKEEIAKIVGIGAIIFNTLSTTCIKDQIFDWNTALNFQGETGPYIQYMYVRTKSIIDKTKFNCLENKNVNILTKYLQDRDSQNLLKIIYSFEDILKQVTEKNEPSILSRYLVDIAKVYSVFYNDNKIIVDDEEIKNSRLFLTYAT
ncbi:MAG: arginine--tRNA ligase, partial [Bacilli bacterium]|nr:arginine--tRNA ligase [Bacilli bacterium]